MPFSFKDNPVSGLLAARPSPDQSIAGLIYRSTDTGQVDLCDGSAWQVVFPPSGTFVAQHSQLFSVKDSAYGAVGDGVTDDGAAIRAACAAAEAAGGGTVYFPRGTYYINSYDPVANTVNEYAMFRLGDKVSAVGEAFGAVSLKMSTSLPGTLTGGNRLSFIATKTGTARQQVRNLIFDANGFVLTMAFSSFNMVRAESTDVLCENLYGKNLPGRNMIVANADRMTIRRVRIINGAQNVPGNTVADDCSMVYLNGAGHVVKDCEFTNEATAVVNCGGVELHATRCTVTGTHFANLKPAMYTGYGDSVTIAYNQQIYGNTFDTCEGGIEFIDQHVGGGIHHNQFNGCGGSASNAIFTPRNAVTGVGTAGVISDVDITDNTFIAGTDFARTPIVVGGWQGGKIDSNTFKGYKNGVTLQSSTTPILVAPVRHNLFLEPPGDAGVSQGLVTISGDGTWASTITDVYVDDNVAVKSGSAPLNTHMLLVSGDPAHLTLTRVQAHGNHVDNLSDDVIFFGALNNAVSYVPLNTTAEKSAEVATSETVASAVYGDAATVGPAVTVTVPASGKVRVDLHASLANAAGGYNFMGVALSGANTVAADDSKAISIGGAPIAGAQFIIGGFAILTGLTPGETTFTAKYRASTGTLTVAARRIAVRGQ